ncbi:hypothetical protein C499_00485 [Halogeometricum borinquense DSM 11551]|uniref:Uncharacterized protein n=1 Tax=Halogeometricum borinquense (strain ATCC 700274 / DSM 11551 / JCM 10706 / KCTC 4070 / PR3) TaxID=469382 RepID=L9V3W7_HALBP|nr:hypothetical protein C499_00485 [Halogeometricum borinquense DSM 11551]
MPRPLRSRLTADEQTDDSSDRRLSYGTFSSLTTVRQETPARRRVGPPNRSSFGHWSDSFGRWSDSFGYRVGWIDWRVRTPRVQLPTALFSQLRPTSREQ